MNLRWPFAPSLLLFCHSKVLHLNTMMDAVEMLRNISDDAQPRAS